MSRLPVAILFAGLGILASILLTQSATIQLFEARSWDVRQRFAASHQPADPRIKLVLVDQSSLDFVSQKFELSWPWPREYHAALVDFLKRGGAKVVGFDLIFSEPSTNGVADDQALADATANFGRVVHAAVVRAKETGAAFETSLAANWTKRIPVELLDVLKRASLAGTSLLLPTPTILAKANSVASVSANSDLDGVFRHALLAGRIGEVIIPNLPMAMALLAGEKIRASALSYFITEANSLAIRFNAPRAYPSFSAAALINSELAIRAGERPQVDPRIFSGALVFVGVSAPGLFDVKPTAIDPKLLGVELNAHILDNLIHGRFAKVFSTRETLLISALFTFIVAGSTFAASTTVTMLFRQFCLLTLWPALAFATALHGVWMPLTTPFAAGAFIALISFAYVYSHEGKQRRFVTSAFKQYVSPEVIESIIAHPEKLSLSGESREITVFFSDIEGFTSMSERLSPSVLSSALNLYLSELTDAILEHGGTVDKYVGDAIIAIWNAPLDDPQHARRAVTAAKVCQERLDKLRPQLNELCGEQFRTRIGIHTGVATVGNFGSKQRFNYTAIGDTVNFAARLESLNKKFGTTILISEQTFSQLNDSIVCRPLGEVKVVGKELFIKIFNPSLSSEEESIFRQFELARLLFLDGSSEQGIARFEELSKCDPVSQIYAVRAKALKAGELLDRWIFESK